MKKNFIKPLKDLRGKLLVSKKERFLCVSTTANINNPPVFIGSVRETATTIAGNIILRNASILDAVAEIFDGKVDYFLVDCEKKNELNNLEVLLSKKIKKSKVFVYKPNDFTIESLDILLAIAYPSFRGKKAAVLGAGNIGSKIALKLCERGAGVFLFDRDGKKAGVIANGLNVIKRSNSIVRVAKNPEEAARGADLILGCTPGVPVISQKMVNLMSRKGKIIDVGNGTIEAGVLDLAQKRGIEALSLSSFGGYVGMIENWLFQRRFFEKKRKLPLGKYNLIVPGVLGGRGDIIVDDVESPKRFIGICDGKGDIIPREKTLLIFEDFLSKIKDRKLAFRIKKLYNGT